jgi:hypothetical protein
MGFQAKTGRKAVLSKARISFKHTEASENLLPQDGQRYLWTPSALRPSRRSGEWHAGHLRSLFAFLDIAAFSSLAVALARLSFSFARTPKSDSESASVSADASPCVNIKKLLPGIWEASGGRSLSPNKPIPGASQILRFVWHGDYTTAGFLPFICSYIRQNESFPEKRCSFGDRRVLPI